MINKKEKDYKKIVNSIIKFCCKYRKENDITFNLKEDKIKKSYNICLYINPTKTELETIQSNIKLKLKELKDDNK